MFLDKSLDSLRNTISNWPSYQNFPRDFLKSRVKVFTREYTSMIFKLSRRVKSKEKKLLRGFEQLVGSKESDMLLIIGGGPSVNNLSIEQINRFKACGGEIMVMNDFAISKLAKLVKVDYYILCDPEYWNIKAVPSEARKHAIVRQYLDQNTSITVIQPTGFSKIVSRERILYISPLPTVGLRKYENPIGFWGHPNYVSLYSLAIARAFAYKEVYFAGLDSSTYRHYEVDDLNRVKYRATESHFYSNEAIEIFKESKNVFFQHPLNVFQKSIIDVLYGEIIYRRSFEYLSRGYINVGSDPYNDACFRASLIT